MEPKEIIQNSLLFLSADCDRDTWIKIGSAVKSAGGDFETFDNWSRNAPKRYDAPNCRSTWNSFTPSGNPEGAAGLLRKLAKEAGALFPDEPMPHRSAPPPLPAPAPVPIQYQSAPPQPAKAADQPPPPPEMPQLGGIHFQNPDIVAPEVLEAVAIQNSDPFKNPSDIDAMERYITECAENKSGAEDFFCKKRGLSIGLVMLRGLGFDTARNAALIPYGDDTFPGYCVRRHVNPPTGKSKYENPKGEKPVYNAEAMREATRPVFILEGQIDALSIIDAGGQACTGLNEKKALIELAKASKAPGFIIVADRDPDGGGEKKAREMKSSLEKETGRQCEIVLMPDNIHDANEFLQQRGIAALSEWVQETEKKVLPERAGMMTLLELEKKIRLEGEADPNELIKNRYICKGGAGILAAETGIGKSSFIMQLALHWSIGLPCFGLEPVRPLKIILIQAENDERDVREEVTGICRGAAEIELWSYGQIERAQSAVFVISDAASSGEDFIKSLERTLQGFRNDITEAEKKAEDAKNLINLFTREGLKTAEAENEEKAKIEQNITEAREKQAKAEDERKKAEEAKPDLVIIDPLFAFAGCDLSNQEDVSKFLRNGINPLLKDFGVAALFVHHTAKPLKTAMPNENFSKSYSYHGSAEIINWARFALVLERDKDKDKNPFFKLIAAKRQKRLNWETNTKYLRWSDDYIYWEELKIPPEMEQPATFTEDRAAQREQRKRDRLFEEAQQAADLLKPGESMTAADFRRAITGRLGITSKSRLETVLAICIDRGFVTERQPTKEEKTSPGIRKMIERPTELPKQQEFF